MCLFQNYRSVAFNFLGLLDCAGDDGASDTLPGPFRYTIAMNVISHSTEDVTKGNKKITGICLYLAFLVSFTNSFT